MTDNDPGTDLAPDNGNATEQRFRSLISQAPVAIAIYSGPELIIEEANASMLNLLGRGAEIVGMPILKARPELEGHAYLEVIRGAMLSGNDHVGTGIKAPVLINGEVIEGYYDVTYRPIKNNEGQVTGVMVVAADVTEKTLLRQRELAMNDELSAMNEELTASNEELMSSQEHLLEVNHNLIESESRFRGLIERSPVAIATFQGRDLVIDCANEMILKIWGKDAAIIGKKLHVALPELKGQPFLQILDNVYASGKPFYGNEVNVSLEHGGKLTEVFANFVYQPIADVNGITQSIMVVANDVTEQVVSRQVLKEKNEELSLLAERLAYVSDSIPQQVWTATPDGALDFVNAQTTEYFGKAADDITGENWIKLVHPADLESAGAAWGHALTTGEPYQTEFRLLSKDGTYVWHLARATAYIEDGKIIKWFGTNTNIDGHKQLEQHKNDFISIASHELKTPLTSLKAILQLLDRIKHDPPAAMLPRLVDQSNRAMQKITSLVDDLLSVSRLNDGYLQIEKSEFNLSKLLSNCCQHITVEGRVEVINVCDEHLAVFADEHLIEQVLVNFVNNAVKYAPESKRVYINAACDNEQVKISVKDTGPGIPPEKLDQLFGRYYRVDHSGQQYSGLGLGLYISSEIVKRHDGQIGVESIVGQGSTFWFTLPVKKA